jgi:tellurite resistance protein TerC
MPFFLLLSMGCCLNLTTTDPGPSGSNSDCDVGFSHVDALFAQLHLEDLMELTSFLAAIYFGQPLWSWILFVGIVIALLAFDLGILHRKPREIPVGESLVLSAAYIAIALVFGAWVWWAIGTESGIDYFTAFIVEKSLAIDNVFVISMIFATLAVPTHLQYRVLFYGILGVIVLRAIVIGLGTAIVSQFEWVLFIFGGLLVLTGVKMLLMAEKPVSIADSKVLKFLRRHLRVTNGVRGQTFFVREPDPASGRLVWYATPLFVALVLVEVVDVIFAVDSVPAVLAITTDPYVVYTSNIFAILGLRALYFALAASMHRFHYLKHALALVLVFIGAKIFVNAIYGKIDPVISLGVTFGLLAGGLLYSLWRTRADYRSENPDARRI